MVSVEFPILGRVSTEHSFVSRLPFHIARTKQREEEQHGYLEVKSKVWQVASQLWGSVDL